MPAGALLLQWHMLVLTINPYLLTGFGPTDRATFIRNAQPPALECWQLVAQLFGCARKYEIDVDATRMDDPDLLRNGQGAGA